MEIKQTNGSARKTGKTHCSFSFRGKFISVYRRRTYPIHGLMCCLSLRLYRIGAVVENVLIEGLQILSGMNLHAALHHLLLNQWGKLVEICLCGIIKLLHKSLPFLLFLLEFFALIPSIGIFRRFIRVHAKKQANHAGSIYDAVAVYLL